jgi:urease accessory protein
MTDISKQLMLQTWMSAAFPTGAFTCSHGLEAAIVDERINDADSCVAWLKGIIQYGSGWNDAVLTAATWSCIIDQNYHQADTKSCKSDLKNRLTQINDLAIALCAGAERLRETTQLGAAFYKSASAFINSDTTTAQWIEGDISLPVAVGICGAVAGISRDDLLASSLQASSSNLVWIATRLLPLGQSDALQIIAALSPLIESTARLAGESCLEELGSGALLADLSSLEHERLQTRICIT